MELASTLVTESVGESRDAKSKKHRDWKVNEAFESDDFRAGVGSVDGM